MDDGYAHSGLGGRSVVCENNLLCRVGGARSSSLRCVTRVRSNSTLLSPMTSPRRFLSSTNDAPELGGRVVSIPGIALCLPPANMCRPFRSKNGVAISRHV